MSRDWAFCACDTGAAERGNMSHHLMNPINHNFAPAPPQYSTGGSVAAPLTPQAALISYFSKIIREMGADMVRRP